jgi:hypothetical protein
MRVSLLILYNYSTLQCILLVVVNKYMPHLDGFTPWEQNRYSFNKSLIGARWRVGGGAFRPPPQPGLETRIVYPIPSRFTAYAIPPP